MPVMSAAPGAAASVARPCTSASWASTSASCSLDRPYLQQGVVATMPSRAGCIGMQAPCVSATRAKEAAGHDDSTAGWWWGRVLLLGFAAPRVLHGLGWVGCGMCCEADTVQQQSLIIRPLQMMRPPLRSTSTLASFSVRMRSTSTCRPVYAVSRCDVLLLQQPKHCVPARDCWPKRRWVWPLSCWMSLPGSRPVSRICTHRPMPYFCKHSLRI